MTRRQRTVQRFFISASLTACKCIGGGVACDYDREQSTGDTYEGRISREPRARLGNAPGVSCRRDAVGLPQSNTRAQLERAREKVKSSAHVD